jgi:hypothetical protein
LQRKFLSILLVVILLLSAIQFPVFAAGEYFASLEGYVSEYNENLDKVPSLAKRMFANERVNFHIKIGDEEEIIGVVTDAECAVEEFVDGEIDDPTIRAYIDGAVIDDLKDDFSVSRALEALKGIRLQGVGFGKVVKVFFLNIAKALAGLFG